MGGHQHEAHRLRARARSTAEFFPDTRPGRNAKPAPHINRRFNLSDEERQRRRDVLAKAISKAGTLPKLAAAVGIRNKTIRHWEIGKHAIPDARLEVLEKYLAGEDAA